jgi:4-amino-4-deoxy-L-arabinose transferase-like glycosyltransferase
MPVRRSLLALLAVVALLFIPPIGGHDWWYPDEPDVVLPAIEMAARGDWVVPSHNQTAWLDYPPLYYWGARVAGELGGGITYFTSRLPIVGFFLILIASTVLLGRRLLNDQAALWAGVVMASFPVMLLQSTMIQVDIGFAAAIAAGMAAYVIGDARTGPAGWLLRIGGFAGFGLAILAKGPLGLLLPGLILTVWHAWNREWLKILALAPLSLAALAVALPWYVLLSQRLGSEYVLNQLYLQNFDRFSQTGRGHGGKGPWYYLTAILPDMGQWLLLLLPALWLGLTTRRNDRSWRLLLVWVIAPFIFFNLASTKRNVYLLPIYPAVALLCADLLARTHPQWLERWQGWATRSLGALLGLVGVLLILAAALFWPHLPAIKRTTPELIAALRPGALVLGLILAVGGGWILRDSLRLPRRAWLAMAATLVVGWTAVLWLVLPVVDTVRSYRPAAHWLVARVPADDQVGFYWPGRENPKRPAWLCHLAGRRLEFFTSAAAVDAWLQARPGRLVLTNPELAPTIPGATVRQDWTISSDRWVVVGR